MELMKGKQRFPSVLGHPALCLHNPCMNACTTLARQGTAGRGHQNLVVLVVPNRGNKFTAGENALPGARDSPDRPYSPRSQPGTTDALAPPGGQALRRHPGAGCPAVWYGDASGL